MVSLKYKKGFIFTIVTLLLFLILLTLAISIKSSSLEQSEATKQLSTARKVILAWQDITEDFTTAFGIRIQRNGTQLTIYDTLPASGGGLEYLRRYFNFSRDFYSTGEIDITFLDSNNNTINISSISSDIVILPFGITYTYPDAGHREREILCPEENCSAVSYMNYQYNYTNATFDCNPLNCTCHKVSMGGCGTGTPDYNWAPNQLILLCLPGDNSCINFSLTMTDSLNRSYQCPGLYCPYTAFTRDKKSTLSVQMTPCWFELQIGGNDGDNQVLEEVRLHEPGSPNTLCSTITNTSVTFTFNTTNYTINIPARFRTRDINFNIMKQDDIELISD
ncbi:hypothetical protein HY570_00560 [Candidatus Micrarchaeota archaeon]|nr:hypothetical protein [Candidatus Micrarchaeota archaeon]